MVHKLIKTDNYLLVVSDEDINSGDYYYSLLDSDIYKNYGTWETIKAQVENYDLKKIAAHLPLNGSPVLEGVDLLPAREDDVDQYGKYVLFKKYPYHPPSDTGYWIDMFKEGYNKAREKYKYTEEDIEAAVAFGMSLERFKDDEHKLSDDDEFKGFIQSLHQYPTEFECETITEVSSLEDVKEVPKTTTINGRRTWVGKYK